MNTAAAKITVPEAIERWLNLRRMNGLSQSAINLDGVVLRRFRKVVGNIQVRSLTTEHIERFFADVAKTVPAASSRQGYRKRLAKFLEHCRRSGWMRPHLDLMATIRAERIPQKRFLILTATEMMQVLDHAKNARDRALFAIGMNTAMRATEITSLRVGDVDLRHGVIAATIHKSGGVDDFPISLELDAELRRWLVAYEAEVGRPLRGDDHLVPTRTLPEYHYVEQPDGTKKRISVPGVFNPSRPLLKPELIITEALRSMGLTVPKGEGMHTLRRSAARAFFDSQVALGYDGALRATSAFLHHANSATTERYLGLAVETRRRDQVLKGKSFLGAIAASEDNVIPLRPVAEG